MDYGSDNVMTLVDGKLEGGATWWAEWAPVPGVQAQAAFGHGIAHGLHFEMAAWETSTEEVPMRCAESSNPRCARTRQWRGIESPQRGG